MKRIFAVMAIMVLVLTLGSMRDYMDRLDISLVSDRPPAISFGGRGE